MKVDKEVIDEFTHTPLIYALNNKYEEIFTFLLEAGCKPNSSPESYYSAL